MKLLRWAPLTTLTALALTSWGLVLFGGGLLAVLAWTTLLPLLLPALSLLVLVGLLVRSAWKRRLDRLFVATLAVAAFGLWPGAWLFGKLQLAFPADVETTAPSLVGRLPADEPLVVAWGGDELAGNYHAASADQRWAYDFVVAPAVTGSARLEDYGCYGIPVVSPIAGKVVVAHDGEPDAEPSRPPSNPTRPLGNHVAIETSSGTFLLLAHLAPGSVVVVEGQHVEAGEVLGRCGNSGNTSEPHIHVHHQRQDPREFPVGFAEGLPLWFSIDGHPRMPRGGLRVDGERIHLVGETVQHAG